jgi:hypothetical protein
MTSTAAVCEFRKNDHGPPTIAQFRFHKTTGSGTWVVSVVDINELDRARLHRNIEGPDEEHEGNVTQEKHALPSMLFSRPQVVYAADIQR